MNRTRNCCAIGVAWLLVVVLSLTAVCQAVAAEPTYKTAAGWWKELPMKWTPVGWKNHLLPLQRAVQRRRGGQARLERAEQEVGLAWRGIGCGIVAFLGQPNR